jgi:hypothetical protein
MTTETVLKAFGQYDSILQKYAPTLPPVIWDRKKRKFAYNRFLSNRKTTLWYFTTLLSVNMGLGGGGALVIYLHILEIGIPLSLFQILFILVFSSLGMSGFVVLTLVARFGETFVDGWNQLSPIEKEMNDFCKKKR